MRIKFVPQDCWVGLFWKTIQEDTGIFIGYNGRVTTWYLCLIPCFPIILRLMENLFESRTPRNRNPLSHLDNHVHMKPLRFSKAAKRKSIPLRVVKG
jgi:hypothetical protein